LTLTHIRRAHHLFPIRPYLSYLIDCLEDTDAHVRDCARQSVVELFTGPAVSDAARADLKKEMSKKSVRKAIVDDVLAKLLSKVSIGSNSQSHEGSENGEGIVDKDYVPPSLALQGKRPRVLSQVSAAPQVATSQLTTKEIPRPSSRAAMSSPPPITPSTENVDVMAVYVSRSVTCAEAMLISMSLDCIKS
jgi:CLIP-associating protein 1/2